MRDLGVSPRDLKMKKTCEVYSSVEILSNKRRPNVGIFSKADNRFTLAKDRVQQPSPVRYNPQSCLSMANAYSPIFKNNAKSIIGKTTLDIIDIKNYKKEKD